MQYERIESKDYNTFHRLLEDYYRDGEDADTPQDEIDSFIQMLFGMILEHKMESCFAKNDGSLIGFVLWAIDTEELPFSEMTGAGTILEIGVISAFRSSGFGKQIVLDTEKQILSKGSSLCYVSAYGPAQEFWARCGYTFNGLTAGNGLPIMVRNIEELGESRAGETAEKWVGK